MNKDKYVFAQLVEFLDNLSSNKKCNFFKYSSHISIFIYIFAFDKPKGMAC